MISMKTTHYAHPNFPPCTQQGFTLEWLPEAALPGELAALEPLRERSGSGSRLPWGALVCRAETGALAGGCAVALPALDDVPSPRHMPHPVLGEWISALRYTGCAWTEAGVPLVRPGFSEEQVLDALWTGLERLMQRNGASFLVGAAHGSSLVLDRALRQGARALESAGAGLPLYFIYAA
jgi:hypothetical protein